MKANRLGCLTGTGILAVLIVTMVIVGSALASGGLMFSPGDLNAQSGALLGGVSSHADIAGNCKACHAAPCEADTMDDRCSTCHANITGEMKDPESIHRKMHDVDPNTKCSTCHPEHKGSTAILTILEGWRFPHEVAHYSLEGHQLKAENEPFLCADCHGNDVTSFDQVTCGECHARMDMTFMVDHHIAFGKNCLECHDGVDRFGDDFDHNKFAFKLAGKHAAVACSQCHVAAHTVGVLKTTSQDCSACHKADDPHKGSLGTDCASCHSPEGWTPSSFDHNRSVFKLDGAHVNVTCKNCHMDGVFKGTPQDCFSCHKQTDPHKGQLGTACEKCHVTSDWKKVNFDHSLSAFPLVGKHVSVECKLCHKDNVFKGTPQDCASCHVDVHLGQLGNDCARCHTSNGWKLVHFDHNTSAFKLTGSHKTVECKSCHINGVFKNTPKDCFSCHAAKDVHKGQFGKDCATCHTTTKWLDISFDHRNTNFPLTGLHVSLTCKSCHVNGVFKGTPTNCFACHASRDVHNGQFGSECSKCHITSGWKNVVFDHNKTAFPLIGTHSAAACKSCHVNGQYTGTRKDCFSCHAAKDAHGGQFGTSCESCHKPTKWTDVTFDHNATAFPLTGTHKTVPCKTCHVNGQYKGTPTDCFSCHAARDAHGGQFGTSCGTCHNTTKWQDATFDHGNTAFPLVSSHATVACGSCHKNGVYKGTPQDCFSCHAARDAHNGQFGTSCGTCHKPTKWSDVTFDHNNTAFPLAGRHRNVQCQSCHVNGVYKGTPTNCFACHAAMDNHNGQFGTNCGSCHDPSGWGNVTFDHNNTAFPLVGHHAQLACGSCHENGVYQGTPAQCIDCHRDEHNGQNGTDCSICHTPTDWGKVK